MIVSFMLALVAAITTLIIISKFLVLSYLTLPELHFELLYLL